MQSLKPMGLPLASSRMCWMNSIISIGVEKAECDAGEMQSLPIGTSRASAISGVILAAGSMPPWPGLAPWLSFSSTIFT